MGKKGGVSTNDIMGVPVETSGVETDSEGKKSLVGVN